MLAFLLAMVAWLMRGPSRQESSRAATENAASVDRLDVQGSRAEAPGDLVGSSRAPLSAAESGPRVYDLEAVVHEWDGPLVDALGAKWKIRLESSGDKSGRGAVMWIEGTSASIEARPGTRLAVLDACLGERLISVRTPSFDLGDERTITLVGDLPARGQVRVVDARTGVDLPLLQVVPWTCADCSTSLPPLAALRSACLRTSPSPILLPANPRLVSYWIGASDHAWRRIEFGKPSGNPIYGLEAGGGLRVSVGLPTDLSTEFVLRLERLIEGASRIEALAEESLESSAPLEFSGLPVGRVTVKVVARRPGREEPVIASRDIDVQPGATADVALDLASAWRLSEFGEIQLTLLLEDDADTAALEVRSERLDAGEPDPHSTLVRELKRGSDGHFHWRSETRTPGRYLVSALPGCATTVVFVEAGSIARATLAVPALPKLRLWTVDARTGSHVVPQLVVWRTVGTSSRVDWSSASLHAVGGAVEFSVAPGRIELGLQAFGYASAKVELEVLPGWNEQVIEFHPVESREIVVRLRSEGLDVPAPEETWSSATLTDSSGRSALLGVKLSGSSAPDGCAGGASSILLVEKSGTYRIAIGRVPGFRTPEPKEVIVGAEVASVDFELVLAGQDVSHP